MVKIRLWKQGAKGKPSYRIVVADDRRPRSGKYIEAIGIYEPTENPGRVRVNVGRARYWLSVGAQPTDTVRRIFSHVGILDAHGDIIRIEGSHSDPVVLIMKELIRKSCPEVAKSSSHVDEFAIYMSSIIMRWREEYESNERVPASLGSGEVEWIKAFAQRVVDGLETPIASDQEIIEKSFGWQNHDHLAAD